MIREVVNQVDWQPRKAAFANLLLSLLALIPWVMILMSSYRGFDLTDEAFYLLSFSRPKEITAFSLYGLVGKPLFDLSGGNVAALRALGVVIWLTVSALTTWVTLGFLSRRESFRDSLASDRATRYRLALLPISGAALYYATWLLTPSYNWLSLVGVALFWTGFLMWLEPERPRWVAYLGAALFAFAAASVFLSRSTSAALLLLYPAGALVVWRSQWRRLLQPLDLLCGVAGLMTGLSLVYLYGKGAQEAIETLRNSLVYMELLIPNTLTGKFSVFVLAVKKTGVFLLRNTYILWSVWLWLPPILIVMFLVNRVRSRGVVRQRYLRAATMILIVGYAASLLLITFMVLPEVVGQWALNVLLLSGIYQAVGHAIQTRLSTSPGQANWAAAIAWAAIICGLVVVFIFGTTNSYSLQIGMGAYFVLLGVITLFLGFGPEHLNSRMAQVAVVTLLLAIAWMTYRGSLTPRRQDIPAWQMDTRISVDGVQNSLLVSEETARYISDLRALAGGAFAAGTPLIDLTGHTPGAVYALGGRAYGLPWLLGGREGSDAATVYILEQWTKSDLEVAWILTIEANGERAISESVLEEVGLEFPVGYERLGTVRRAASNELQALWRPAGDN